MKTNCFLTLALFFIFVSPLAPGAPMLLQEQETGKMEIQGVVNAIIKGLEKLDAELLFQSYSNSPGFILFTTDGTMADYRMAKNHHVQWFKSLSSLKVTTVAEESRFLSADAAVCAWRTAFAMTLKSGGEPTVDFAITFILKKTDNHWQVVYQQTSTLPPPPAKPGK